MRFQFTIPLLIGLALLSGCSKPQETKNEAKATKQQSETPKPQKEGDQKGMQTTLIEVTGMT